MSKTFTQAPKPPPLADNVISAFERGGTGQDTRSYLSPKVGRGEPTNTLNVETTNVELGEPSLDVKVEPTNVGKRETTRRLSIDLPESWHRRFKTACSRTDKKMLAEVTEFIKRRTMQLEEE
jgi:hypothetical protein